MINDDDDLPNLKEKTVSRLLKDMKFKFMKRSRSAVLIERPDIIAWRHRYLRQIKLYRQANRKIYYLDETWVNAGHTVKKVWHDTTAEEQPRRAWFAGLTTGLKEPSGKGGRIIVVHCGSEDGFVADAGLVYQAKKGVGDYHEEMDGPRFTRWFNEQLLPNVQPQSVIVMDNASYHSVRLEKIPTSSSLKAVIQQWLTSKNIPWQPDMLRAELLEIVKQNKHQHESYQIDHIAEQAGHTVLRLPAYHCELNPIENV